MPGRGPISADTATSSLASSLDQEDHNGTTNYRFLVQATSRTTDEDDTDLDEQHTTAIWAFRTPHQAEWGAMSLDGARVFIFGEELSAQLNYDYVVCCGSLAEGPATFSPTAPAHCDGNASTRLRGGKHSPVVRQGDENNDAEENKSRSTSSFRYESALPRPRDTLFSPPGLGAEHATIGFQSLSHVASASHHLNAGQSALCGRGTFLINIPGSGWLGPSEGPFRGKYVTYELINATALIRDADQVRPHPGVHLCFRTRWNCGPSAAASPMPEYRRGNSLAFSGIASPVAWRLVGLQQRHPSTKTLS